MRSSIKVLLLAVFVLVILTAGEFVLPDIIDNSITLNPSNPSSSVTYIQNGVSGVVTIKDPTLNNTLTLNVEYFLTSGSGVIVTKNGYIITAFHVIGDPQTLETQQKLKKMSNDDINRYVEQAAVAEYLSSYNPQLGRTLNGNLPVNLQTGSSNLTNFFVENNLISVNSAKQVIKVKIFTGNSLDAQLVDVGNPDNDEDVALLKVNKNNLHALPINSNNPLHKSVRIFGYPAGNSMNLASSSGSVINKIVNTQRITYYETNAPTTNGYSGGPALDNRNRIMGIIIYTIQSRGNFRSETNSSYSAFLSSNYLIQICNKNNVPITIS